ncbi:hypothetical protein TNIN_313641 [Trichonephila inaurata madagascariensis]|uniref:Uncharacterized protein n=1 Tax=Trichonephila inaurata madagascariensis TaxID=2747483 RepID=A0A8X6XUM6_9ARAC|nr:hypothetical protein TNIN_313641 [Trichonephila inaurata madagascariensis]
MILKSVRFFIQTLHQILHKRSKRTSKVKKKTPAQRMREYRARKKAHVQSTSDSPLVVHHQDDEILLADDNLNTSNEFVVLPCQDINATRRKTPAERMREYRRRRRNVVESELVQESKHQVPYVE